MITILSLKSLSGSCIAFALFVILEQERFNVLGTKQVLHERVELTFHVHGVDLVDDGIATLVHASRAEEVVKLGVGYLEAFDVVGARVSTVFCLQGNDTVLRLFST